MGRRIGSGVHVLMAMLEQMFIGRHNHTLDNKGRLTVPSRYREILNGGAVITKGFETNLVVMRISSFEDYSRQVNEHSYTDPTARILKRLVFAQAEQVEVDGSGRILIPPLLRQSAELDGNVVLAGIGPYFEIWSPENWLLQEEQLNNNEANNIRFKEYPISAN